MKKKKNIKNTSSFLALFMTMSILSACGEMLEDELYEVNENTFATEKAEEGLDLEENENPEPDEELEEGSYEIIESTADIEEAEENDEVNLKQDEVLEPSKIEDGFYEIIESTADIEEAEEFEEDESYWVALYKLEKSKLIPEWGWDETAKIVGRFPIYISGIEEPSYYEYKIMEGDRDAGYILVNTNDSDIIIPEVAVQGPTLTERYLEVMDSYYFKIYRYNFIESAAKISAGYGDEEIVAIHGVTNSDRPVLIEEESLSEEFVQGIVRQDYEYTEIVKNKQTVPWALAETLENYHGKRKSVTRETFSELQKIGAEELAEIRSSTAYLDHSFPISGSSHVPNWWRPWDSHGNELGCAAIAWGQVLAYWHQFKYRPGLFDYVNMEDYDSRDEFATENAAGFPASGSPCRDGCWEIAYDLEMTFGVFNGNHYGRVTPNNMHQGCDYVTRQSYPGSTFEKEDSGPYGKWNLCNGQIKKDNPAMVLTHHDGIGIPDHYVAVVGTHKDTSGIFDGLGYYCNWNSKSFTPVVKWIYDLDGEPDYSIWDTFALKTIPQNYPDHSAYLLPLMGL